MFLTLSRAVPRAAVAGVEAHLDLRGATPQCVSLLASLCQDDKWWGSISIKECKSHTGTLHGTRVEAGSKEGEGSEAM